MGDVTALAATLDTLASDPERRGRVGREALDLARERYALDHVVERYDAIYTDLSSRRKRADRDR